MTSRCYYLIDEKAPDELQRMKEDLDNTFRLGAIGQLLDDLERILGTDDTKPRIVNKAQRTKRLFDYVIPEISKYATRMDSLRDEISRDHSELDLNIDVWQKALEMTVEALAPIVSQVFVLESLEKVDTANRTYRISVRTYANGIMDVSHKTMSFEEVEEYESHTSAIVMTRQGSQISLGLFPFLLIKDDKLYYYKRTRYRGYEYHSIHDSRAHLVRSKSKFSRRVFKTTGRAAEQALFWTEVIPSINEKSGVKVKANIPTTGPVEFVGRKSQLTKIRHEILEIPNQNGIIYGLGGVGKTALMIRLSRELFEEENPENVLFDNIIWMSAKSNYYNPTLNIIELRKRQLESLDTVISTMLDFFEFEGIEEYNFEDRKGLLLELLQENKVLLVLDNLESISPKEAEEIIRFFEVEVKRNLRRKPENFKVIITSRKQIASGFHQLELRGLGLRESKQLMSSLYSKYKSSHAAFTEEQKKMLHEATFGIPILIKHCLGQVYEYSRPFDAVVKSLSATPNKAIEFSYEEILKLLKNDDCQLEIMLLLELMNYPLLLRQIADILARDESEIETKMPPLANFQCVKRINQGRLEKYMVNDEIRLLTRRLVREHTDSAQDIRHKITKNFTLEKQMDYSTEELSILSTFDGYLSEKQFLDAERFMKAEMEERPLSILLKYRYAKYLKEQKREIEEAIKTLEAIRELAANDPSILWLLISCYMSHDVPNYGRASVYVQQLENLPLDDESLKLQIAEFYVRWSLYIKMNRDISFDPLEEILRQQRYKELADRALVLLGQITNKTHKVYYLLAQSQFNKWDNETAFRMIDKAIQLCKEDPRHYPAYNYLRKLILKQQAKYSGRRSASD